MSKNAESLIQNGVQTKGQFVIVSDTPVEETEISAWFWVLFGLTIFILVVLIILLIKPNFFNSIFSWSLRLRS